MTPRWSYYGAPIPRERPHACTSCKAANMKRDLLRCHFRAVRWGICDVCKLPIFKDESRQANAVVTCHVRCQRGAQPRPEWLDRLECVPELEKAA